MLITKAEKVEGGYNVSFENCDMIAFVHKQEEIDDLKKKGIIKDNPSKGKVVKKGK